jgi:hypothetical protein
MGGTLPYRCLRPKKAFFFLRGDQEPLIESFELVGEGTNGYDRIDRNARASMKFMFSGSPFMNRKGLEAQNKVFLERSKVRLSSTSVLDLTLSFA